MGVLLDTGRAPQRALFTIAVSAVSRLWRPVVRAAHHHHDDEIAQYATQTFRRNSEGVLVLIAETPAITYGQLRERSSS